MAEKTCEQCGRVFEAKRSTARFCSSSCRIKAHRAKVPIMPAVVPAPFPMASFNEVAEAVGKAREVSNEFAQLSVSAPQPLRPGCRRIGEAITRAIDDEEW